MKTNRELAPLAVSVAEAGQLLNISERLAWTLIKRGELRSLKVSNQRRVLVKSVHDYLEREANKVQPRERGVEAMLAARAAKRTQRPRLKSRTAA